MCKLYGGTLVSEHQTNHSSLKIQEIQKEIHEPSPICNYAEEADKQFNDKLFYLKILHFNLYLKWKISIILISFHCEIFFETEIVANGSVLPFKNLLSLNKFWENGKVFLNFSTFCLYLTVGVCTFLRLSCLWCPLLLFVEAGDRWLLSRISACYWYHPRLLEIENKCGHVGMHVSKNFLSLYVFWAHIFHLQLPFSLKQRT